MSKTIKAHRLTDLSNVETINEILLNTRPNIVLYIVSNVDETIIKLPFGNKVEIIDGCIVIHDTIKSWTK